MPDFCRSCRAPIRWAVTESGRRLPLDRDPAPDGNVRLAAAQVRGGTPRAVVVAAEKRPDLAGELYVPHWATCKFADQHRKEKG
jgi:hypothetical protein